MNVVLRAAGISVPIRLFAALCLFSLVYICYQAGLRGPFLLDDFSSVLNAKIDSLRVSEIRGALDTDLSVIFSRVIPVLTFSLNDYLGDGTPFSYKLTNLVIHSAIALAMYCFLVKALTLIGSPTDRISSSTAGILAFVCTAMRALHHSQIGTVLYVVQRMAMLSTLFTVLALRLFLIIRTTHLRTTPNILWVVGIVVSIIFACLSKENGDLAILYRVFLESTFLQLELVFEHRNYLGMIGIILPIVSLAYIVAKSLGYPNILKFVGVIVVLQLSFATHLRAIEWSETELFHQPAMIEKPGAIRALYAWTRDLASQGKYRNYYSS